ncbi:MAG: EAL domain-containing protein [Gammaproteobacteria bacterium]|nr:EAL domain-containing protein [Gammaproteobacteria bacterium]
MLNISPIFRLTIGIILLTVSLLLISDLLGIAPDQKSAEMAARRVIAEALAVNVSNNLNQGLIETVEKSISEAQQRNDSVLSVGLRRGQNNLIAQAGDHNTHWVKPGKDSSTTSHVQVPIYNDSGRWGVLEISFRPLDSFMYSLFNGGSIATMILFVIIFGFVVYWLFLKRALSELDPSSVVPERVREALDILAEGLVILDRRGHIVLANKAFQTKLGSAAKSIIGGNLSSLSWIWPHAAQRQDDNEWEAFPWESLLAGSEAPKGIQLTLKTPAKEAFIFGINASAIKTPGGKLSGVVVTFDDLTELERKNSDLERTLGRLEKSQREITRQNRELQVLATRDPLTNCLNRRSLFEGIGTLLHEAKTVGEPLSCIMTDIDHFKLVNDRYGHAMGDKVIKLLAQILSDSSRTEDLVGRYGGEEFCVILPDIDEASAAEIAERMRLEVYDGGSARFSSGLHISCSFGVATDMTGDLTSGALVDMADQALYQAKETGRNRVIRHSQLGEPIEPKNQHEEADTPDDKVAVDKLSVINESSDVSKLDEQQEAPIVEYRENHLHQEEGLEEKRDDTDDLPGQVVVLDRITQAIQHGQRFDKKMAVLSIDVETVRNIRGMLDNRASEKLQRIIAKHLKQLLRTTDTVSSKDANMMGLSLSHTGNGEFVVLLADIRDSTVVTWITSRLLSSLQETINLYDHEISLDVRIGVSLFPEDGNDPETLLTNAAAATREAKTVAGRSACLYYNEEMNSRAKKLLYLEGQLYHALERDELYLVYQPIINVRTKAISGFEALLRWNHPEIGEVFPDQFIPIAEHTGLIDEIGEWVLRVATHQLKTWHNAGFDNLTMAVNFSAIQFRNEKLAELVESILDKEGLLASKLVAEITESALIRNIDNAVVIIDGLSKVGVKIALDDFGTGYSSLGYLKRFAIDVVKVDRSFLSDFPMHPHDTQIVSAILAMAHSLGLQVVTEGVEENVQLKVLMNMGCDYMQGYLLSRPIPCEAATKLLASPVQIRRIFQAAGGSEGKVAANPSSLVSDILNEPPNRGVA